MIEVYLLKYFPYFFFIFRDKTLLHGSIGVVTLIKLIVVKFDTSPKDKEFYLKCPGLVFATPLKNSNCVCGDDLSKNALGLDCIPSISHKKSDEKKPSVVCVDGEFRCQDGEKCIKNMFLCDGVFSCSGNLTINKHFNCCDSE